MNELLALNSIRNAKKAVSIVAKSGAGIHLVDIRSNTFNFSIDTDVQ
jgi:hypothetical protein